jgi:putative membrane protein insertion efficiency factor
MRQFLAALPRRLVMGLILLYRYSLASVMGQRCRYFPSCSEYGLEAVKRHGALAGGWLAAKRIARCHPWGGWGYDPVPESPRQTANCCGQDHHHKTPEGAEA